MNPFQQAIMRVLMGHYGGHINDPRVGQWLSRMAQSADAGTRTNQSFIGQLGAGVMPQGYQPYQGHSIPGGTHAVVNQLRN